MTKFVRTANEKDLYAGSVLLYGDTEIMLLSEFPDGTFGGMHEGLLFNLHPSKISHFQVEIEPLTLVK